MEDKNLQSKDQVCQVEGSLFATMLSGRWEDSVKRDQDGAVYAVPKELNKIIVNLRLPPSFWPSWSREPTWERTSKRRWYSSSKLWWNGIEIYMQGRYQLAIRLKVPCSLQCFAVAGKTTRSGCICWSHLRLFWCNFGLSLGKKISTLNNTHDVSPENSWRWRNEFQHSGRVSWFEWWNRFNWDCSWQKTQLEKLENFINFFFIYYYYER